MAAVAAAAAALAAAACCIANWFNSSILSMSIIQLLLVRSGRLAPIDDFKAEVLFGMPKKLAKGLLCALVDAAAVGGVVVLVGSLTSGGETGVAGVATEENVEAAALAAAEGYPMDAYSA